MATKKLYSYKAISQHTQERIEAFDSSIDAAAEITESRSFTDAVGAKHAAAFTMRLQGLYLPNIIEGSTGSNPSLCSPKKLPKRFATPYLPLLYSDMGQFDITGLLHDESEAIFDTDRYHEDTYLLIGLTFRNNAPDLSVHNLVTVLHNYEPELMGATLLHELQHTRQHTSARSILGDMTPQRDDRKNFLSYLVYSSLVEADADEVSVAAYNTVGNEYCANDALRRQKKHLITAANIAYVLGLDSSVVSLDGIIGPNRVLKDGEFNLHNFSEHNTNITH